METNFNSQICTDKIQSERLLALGLKKETADCALLPLTDKVTSVLVKPSTKDIKNTIPAWSLHRLWELGKFMGIQLNSEVVIPKLYEFAIAKIEQQIKGGYFNKEYLED